MAKKIDLAAAIHLAYGALDAVREDVPVGDHDLGNVVLELIFPAAARVIRAEGTAGDGFDEKPAPSRAALEITRDAALLFVERSAIRNEGLWRSCILDAMKGLRPDIPPDAIAALAEVEAARPDSGPAEPIRRKTPAKRSGEKEIVVNVKRVKVAPKGAKAS